MFLYIYCNINTSLSTSAACGPDISNVTARIKCHSDLQRQCVCVAQGYSAGKLLRWTPPNCQTEFLPYHPGEHTEALQTLQEVNIHVLRLNSGSASFDGRIWRPITSQRLVTAVAIWGSFQMRPTNAVFFSLFLEDTPLQSFFAPKKEERKRENGDIAWRRSSLSPAWVAQIVR